MRILCGDIGGTHCRLAIAAPDDQGVELLRSATIPTAGHPDPYAVLAEFLGDTHCQACCLAVAGPTDGQRVSFTNLDWDLDAAKLAERFGFSRAGLVNDFAAVGWGLDGLDSGHIHRLQAGQALAGAPRLALGAGTGLGVCLSTWRGDHYRPLDSEGGHMGFAPTTPEQDRLLTFLRTLHAGRVSVERILSGPGLEDLYRFCLVEADRPEPPDLSAATVGRAGLAGDDPDATRALALFTRILGQTAGDLALAFRAAAGVYLAGGIAPRLRPALEQGAFLAGFRDKGRFADWMASLPVDLVLDPDIGLKGAALAALRGLD